MKKRRGRRRKSKSVEASNLGVAWYRPEQWGRLLEVSADRDELEATYEEWKAHAESTLQKLEKAGVRPRKVSVDVEELLLYCNSEGRPVDSAARAEFAALKLRERDQERQREE